MLLFYLLYCICICVPSFGMFTVFLVSRPIPDFYAEIPAFYADIPFYLGFYARYRAWCTRGVLVCLGGVCSLVHGVNRACSLTCYPDPWFWVPVRLPFPQGTGEPSSADHPWVGPRNGDCDASIYPPLYLRKRFLPFICHESTQLREHGYSLPP